MNIHFTHHTCFGRTALALLLALITTATARADKREGNWYYVIIDGHAVITDLNLSTSVTTITIPETLGGVTVTGFDDFTLEAYTNLELIEFPANSHITTIPTNFARGLSNLTVVAVTGSTHTTGYYLPASITTIEAGAFAGTDIIGLNMPSVTTIGVGAFEGCNSLYRVTISQAATIADDAFANIDRPDFRYCFITYNGDLAKWSYKAYRYSPNVIVFCNDGSCGWAGNTGTQNCVYWTNDGQGNVLFACDDADAYSQHPTAQVKLNNNWNMPPDGTGVLTMTSLTIRNVYTTGVWGSSIETVDLQEGVKAIDEGAFENCTNLTSVSMTADVKKIGEEAFYGCTSLVHIYFWGTWSQWTRVRRGNDWKSRVSPYFQLHYRCTATFNMQGHGTAPAAKTVWNGHAVTRPATDPTAQGYRFDGWYDNAACTGSEFDFATRLNNNKTLYAKWTPLPNTITFDLDNKGTPVADQTVYSGNRVTEPAMQFTQSEGIEGWYTDAARQQRYDFRTPVDHSMTLYAKWVTAGTATFSVTDGGTVTLTDAQGRTPNADGWLIPGQYTLTVKPQSGYTFTGTYELTKRSQGHSMEKAINGSTERSYTLDLTDDDVAVNIAFSTQPIVSINVATDGTSTAGTWELKDGFGNSYDNGSDLIRVYDDSNVSAFWDIRYDLTLTVATDGNTRCAVTIVNNGVTTVYSDASIVSDITPKGSIDIELFFYDKTASVVTLLDGSSNADLISAANGKKCLVTLSGRTLKKDGNWNTLCLPFDVMLASSILANATLMEIDTEGTYDGYQTGFDDGTLRLYFKESTSIKAGKPYLIKWTKHHLYDEYSCNYYDITDPVFAGVTINSAAPTAVTSADEKVAFTGTYDPVSITAEDRSILYLGAENTLYYPQPDLTDASNPVYPNIGAFRAYFQLNGIEVSPDPSEEGVRGIVLGFGEGEATGVTTPLSNRRGVGGEAAWFSLDGRRLSGKPSQPGVYIHNGRKMVVK